MGYAPLPQSNWVLFFKGKKGVKLCKPSFSQLTCKIREFKVVSKRKKSEISASIFSHSKPLSLGGGGRKISRGRKN